MLDIKKVRLDFKILVKPTNGIAPIYFDNACMSLFDKTPFAYSKALEWSSRKEEFVKRAGFVLMACLAVHDKASGNEEFLAYLQFERGLSDNTISSYRRDLRQVADWLGSPPKDAVHVKNHGFDIWLQAAEHSFPSD